MEGRVVCFIPHYLVSVRGMYTVQNPIAEGVVHNSKMTVEDVDSAVSASKGKWVLPESDFGRI